MEAICGDLAAEHDALDRLVAGLDEWGWDLATPAVGWTVRDQVGHLAFFDDRGREAVTDPAGFLAALPEAAGAVAAQLERGRSLSGPALLSWWRQSRATLLIALAGLDSRDRLPWYGPPMGALSFATARLMETWAHGQDVADAMGVERPATGRLRHVCHIGVRALPYSFEVRGLPAPGRPVRVELTAPSGETWAWGEEGAADVVRGAALDFALVATQRRHRDDTSLQAEGPVAGQWLSIAQAFAGPPGPGRSKRPPAPAPTPTPPAPTPPAPSPSPSPGPPAQSPPGAEA